MEEKRFKILSLLLMILTRIVQIGIILALFDMTGPFYNAAETIFGKPKTFMDQKFVDGIGVMPLFAIIPALVVAKCVRLRLIVKLTGKTEDEYKEDLIKRMPPEAVERAKRYEANSKELKAYLNSIKDELGFTKDEVTWLFTMFFDNRKEIEREKAEERAKREAEAREHVPFFSEETHKKADEAKKRLKSLIKRK